MAGERIDRLELQFEHFQKSLARLREALAQDESSFVRDSIIKRFEVTFEMAWKTLFRYLVDQGEDVAAKAWNVLPVAFQSKLIDNAGVWDQMRTYRNDTSHEYTENKAIEISAFVRAESIQAFEQLAALMNKRLIP